MSNSFLATKIAFSEDNHCSVFFAHLQNIIKKVYQSNVSKSSQTFELDKICHVINDIYCEHAKLERSYDELSKSTKNMMVEFTEMLNECKDDRQKLMQVTKERFDMLQKLKECNNDAMELSAENQILKETVAKLKQINDLLMQKSKVTEQQLANRKIAEVGAQSFHRISTEYDRLLESNTQIRKQLLKICTQSQAIQKISKPIQLINRAFKMDPTIKNKIWQIGSKQEHLSVSYQKQFEQFNFDQFFKEIRDSANA